MKQPKSRMLIFRHTGLTRALIVFFLAAAAGTAGCWFYRHRGADDGSAVKVERAKPATPLLGAYLDWERDECSLAEQMTPARARPEDLKAILIQEIAKREDLGIAKRANQTISLTPESSPEQMLGHPFIGALIENRAKSALARDFILQPDAASVASGDSKYLAVYERWFSGLKTREACGESRRIMLDRMMDLSGIDEAAKKIPAGVAFQNHPILQWAIHLDTSGLNPQKVNAGAFQLVTFEDCDAAQAISDILDDRANPLVADESTKLNPAAVDGVSVDFFRTMEENLVKERNTMINMPAHGKEILAVYAKVSEFFENDRNRLQTIRAQDWKMKP